jgi:hypothetical protein
MARSHLTTYFESFETDIDGQIFMTGPVDVSEYSKVNLQITQFPHAPVAMTVNCAMGKISGETLSQVLASFPLGTTGPIHSFDVIGPEFNLVLTDGPPNVSVPIQAWLFLN